MRFLLKSAKSCQLWVFLALSFSIKESSAYYVRRSSKEMKVGVMGAGFGRGQPRPGVENGPMIIRSGGFIEYLRDEAGVDVRDYGDIAFQLSNNRIRTPYPDANRESGGIMNVEDVSKMAKMLSDNAEKIAKEGRVVLTLGGDHSITIGTVNGMANVFPDLSLLYVDAHADLNTVKTSPSGNLHGMTIPFAIMELSPEMQSIRELNWIKPRIPARNLAHIGLRSVDAGERYLIDKLGIASFGVRDIDRLGVMEVTRRALARISPGGSRPVHLSFDIDVLDDDEIGSQTGTPEPGGLTLRDAMTFLEVVQESVNVVSIDFAEVNVALGSGRSANRTAQLVKYMMGCMFGYCRGGLTRAQS